MYEWGKELSLPSQYDAFVVSRVGRRYTVPFCGRYRTEKGKQVDSKCIIRG